MAIENKIDRTDEKRLKNQEQRQQKKNAAV